MFDETARMTADDSKDLVEKIKEQVRQTIQGLNIPEEIRKVANKRIMESVPALLERNVPSMVEGMVNAKIGWYREVLENYGAEVLQLKKELAEEASKRRKVHRSHLEALSQLKGIEERLKALEPEEPTADKKTSIFCWKRKGKVLASSHAAKCI